LTAITAPLGGERRHWSDMAAEAPPSKSDLVWNQHGYE